MAAGANETDRTRTQVHLLREIGRRMDAAPGGEDIIARLADAAGADANRLFGATRAERVSSTHARRADALAVFVLAVPTPCFGNEKDRIHEQWHAWRATAVPRAARRRDFVK